MTKRLALCLFLALFLTACARSIILLDRADYHYQNGLKMLNQGNLEGAKVEFEYAAFLDPGFGPAYVGLALVHGTMGDMEKALENMKKAQSLYGDRKNAAP